VQTATAKPLAHDLDAVSVRQLEGAVITPVPEAQKLLIDTYPVAKSATTVETANETIAVTESAMIVGTVNAILVDLAAATTAVIAHAATGLESTIAGMRETGPPETAEIREA
jgi:hypothetical protein